MTSKKASSKKRINDGDDIRSLLAFEMNHSEFNKVELLQGTSAPTKLTTPAPATTSAPAPVAEPVRVTAPTRPAPAQVVAPVRVTTLVPAPAQVQVRTATPAPVQAPVCASTSLQMTSSMEMVVEERSAPRKQVTSVAVKVVPVPVPVKAPLSVSQMSVPSAQRVTVQPAEIVLSRVEQHKESGTIKLRFHNPTLKEVSARVQTPLPPMQVWMLNLSGKRLQQLNFVKGQAFTMTVKPHALMNIEIIFANC